MIALYIYLGAAFTFRLVYAAVGEEDHDNFYHAACLFWPAIALITLRELILRGPKGG